MRGNAGTQKAHPPSNQPPVRSTCLEVARSADPVCARSKYCFSLCGHGSASAREKFAKDAVYSLNVLIDTGTVVHNV